MYKWLLFDADGTLFDFAIAETKALANTFTQFEMSYSEKVGDIYRGINTNIWAALERGEITPNALRTTRFQRLFDAVGQQADSNSFSDAYLKHLGNCGDLIEGAESIVKTLSENYRLGLITNGLADVQHPRLAASPIKPYFETIIISDEVGSAKPDSHIFDVAFASMGNPAKGEVIIIGDSLTSDMQGGVNYGIDTCWYNPNDKSRQNGLPITFEIKALAELNRIL
ncbi:MAG: noncanonical pyrimidine nucleotidase, YjjG family [Chloroflexi bacterium]|nr:MAG: noncanonical pyrimidine nucleotidase, YjjG family [Chloroflexota bacterium]